MEINLKRVNQAVHFEGSSDSSEIKVHIDGSPEIGGEGLGVRPMELVLMALGSCSVLDLISILKKQRQDIQNIQIEVSGNRTDIIPKVFTDIHLKFKIQGNEVNLEKVEKAAELAVKKYCSVHDMLSAGGVDISYEIEIL